MENLSTRKIKNIDNNEYAIPIYTPRTTYNYILNNDELLLNDLTLNFDPYTISILKNEFKDKNWKLNLIEFISILKDNLVNWQLELSNRDKKITRSLILLFNQINTSKKNYIIWEEFKNYIIYKASVIDNMNTQNEEIKNYTFTKSIINKKLNQLVLKCIYIKFLNQLAWFEENSDEIFFANSDNGEILKYSFKVEINVYNKKFNKKNTPLYNARKAMLLDIIFIENDKYNLLVTSSNDGIIRMFRYSTNGFVPADENCNGEKEIVYDNAQIIIVWDYINEILYSGQRDGVINVWDQKSEPQYKKLGSKVIKKSKKNFKFNTELNLDNIKNRKNNKNSIKNKKIDDDNGHNQVITCLLPLSKLQFLASASLDKKIILWDTIKYEKRRDYKNYHKMGINCLDFNENLILLISGGLDHEIFIWNPYIDAPVYNLSGHLSSIIGLKFAFDPLHIISWDSDSIIKIWNIKKFKCLDTFNLINSDDKHKFNPQFLNIIQKPLKLIVTGKNINIYEYGKNNGNDFSDDNISVSIKYIEDSHSLLTAVGNKVKIWNLLTGEIKKIFSNLTKFEISVVNLDFDQKRFLLGDIKGNISVHNIYNGAELKSLKKKNKSEITHLIHAPDQKCIISLCIENEINIYSDNHINESEWLKKLTFKKYELISIFYYIPENDNTKNKINGFLGISEGKGNLIRYEILNGKKTLNFKDENDKSEITCLEYIEKINTSIYCNISGKITFLISPPFVIKNHIIGSWSNLDKILNIGVCILQIYYDSIDMNIYFFDEKGWIKCLNISNLVERWNLEIINNDNNSKLKSDPTLLDDDIVIKWEIQAFFDNIKTFEIVKTENILIASGLNKKVKFFSLNDGNYLESLKIKKNKNKPKAVAFKKVDSEEIYSPRMTNRIDYNYIILENEKSKLKQEMIKKNGFINYDELMKLEENNIKKNSLELIKEFEIHEFDPFFYYEKKIHKNSLKDYRSNNWNLYLNYEKTNTNLIEKVKNIDKELDKLNKEENNNTFNFKNLSTKNYYNSSKNIDKDKIKSIVINKMNSNNLIFDENNNALISTNKLPKIKKNPPKKSKPQRKKFFKLNNYDTSNDTILGAPERKNFEKLAALWYDYDPSDDRIITLINPLLKLKDYENNSNNNNIKDISKIRNQIKNIKEEYDKIKVKNNN